MSTDTASPFSRLPGAVSAASLAAISDATKQSDTTEASRIAANSDVAELQHYGNPTGEQKALAAGQAVVDLSHRAVLTVAGPDRLTWLDSLTSQSIAGLAPGESAETLLLTANGRIEHAIRIVDDGATAWLLIDAAQLDSLHAWLERMRFMLRVEVADRTSDFATVGVLGAAEHDGALSAVLPVVASPNGHRLVWQDPWREVQTGGWAYASVVDHPAAEWDYRELLIDRDRLSRVVELVESGRVTAAGFLALDALRIAAWRPGWATEVDEKSVPHELDWLRSAVHLHKGCYRGQETVAKVHNLGHPPRRVVFLQLDGSESVLPVHGDEVFVEDTAADEARPVGYITSSARHFELGPVALAILKRTTDPAAPLIVHTDGARVAAAQEIIVRPDAGATAPPPRLPRLGAVVRRPKS